MVDLNELATQACQVVQAQQGLMQKVNQSETFVSEDQEKKQSTTTSCHRVTFADQVTGLGQVQDQQPASEVTGLGKVSNQQCAADVSDVSDVQSVTSHMSVGIPVQGTTTVSKPNVSTAPTADASSGGGGRPESPEPRRGIVRRERTEAQWQNLCRSMGGPGVGDVHGNPVLPEHKAGPPPVPSVRGVEQHERQQTGIPLIPADSAPVEPMQPMPKAKPGAKAKARPMASTSPVYLPDMDMEGEWGMEPGPYPSSTMTSSSATPEVHALQQRMLNMMENALMRIMHHLEGQAHAAPVPEPTTQTPTE